MARKKKEKMNGGAYEEDVIGIEPTDDAPADDVEALPEPLQDHVDQVLTEIAEAATPKRTRYLRHELTKREHRHMGRRLSENFKTIEDEEARLANLTDEVKRAKGKIAGLEGDNRILSRTMREGFEFREVECEEVRNERLFQVDTIRCDTGEVLESRPFTAKERQGDLFPVERPTTAMQPGGALA